MLTERHAGVWRLLLDSFAARQVQPADLEVMVVEDHELQRALLAEFLGRIGVRGIRQAANGREALRQLDGGGQAAPDVIVCDLEMPEMDGVEFLREVAARKLARGVIIVSSHDSSVMRSVEVMAAASGLPVLGYLKKPFGPDRLRALLARDLSAAQVAPAPLPLDPGVLRAALEACEIHAAFQPKVRLADGAVVGAEALARWSRGAGPLRPLDFIPAMQVAGLMPRLTERMLDEACRALLEWERTGLRCTVSVNVSMETLGDLRTADRFATRVRDHGVDPARIVLEVTETEVMSDVVSVLNVLARLRLKGFRLSIDDFGTGHASLAQLNTIPFNELKIDQTFVRTCTTSKRLRTIVDASLELARRLGISSVAEGVESYAEWDFLHHAGCDEAQGYFIAPAMPAADFAGWASRWRLPQRPPPP